MVCGVNGLRDEWIATLFDFQRFIGDLSLAELIEDTDLRCAHGDKEAFALPDDVVGALAGAQGETGNVLCALCGAVLRSEEALQAHIFDAHWTNRP